MRHSKSLLAKLLYARNFLHVSMYVECSASVRTELIANRSLWLYLPQFLCGLTLATKGDSTKNVSHSNPEVAQIMFACAADALIPSPNSWLHPRSRFGRTVKKPRADSSPLAALASLSFKQPALASRRHVKDRRHMHVKHVKHVKLNQPILKHHFPLIHASIQKWPSNATKCVSNQLRQEVCRPRSFPKCPVSRHCKRGRERERQSKKKSLS